MSEDPEDDAHIRDLLAELGSGPDGEPMPPAVAARLDETLARLVAERDDAGTVVPLRRRWLPRATAAAAAIVVLGAGGVAASNLGVFGDDALTSADSGGSAGKSTSTTGPEATASSPDQSGGSGSGADAGAVTALPELTAASFASEVEGLLGGGTPSVSTPEQPLAGSARKSPGLPESRDQAQDESQPDPAQPDQAQEDAPLALGSVACPGPRPDDGAVATEVRIDGRPAVLLVHPAGEGGQLVEAWSCAGDRRLAETTVTP